MSLESIVETSVNGLGFKFYGLDIQKHNGQTSLCVYVDGISVDDCKSVSLNLKPVLNVEANLPDDYILEVSSPGMDRILFVKEHFNEQIGKTITVKLYRKIDGRRNFKGILNQVEQENIIIEVDGENYTLPFNDIEQARLVPIW